MVEALTNFCFTCNSEHDPDKACPPMPRPKPTAERRWGSDYSAGPIKMDLGPVFIARFQSECSAGDRIEEGDEIRTDGQGAYCHAREDCEPDG